MNRDFAELEERFQQLNRSRSALSAEMRAIASELQEQGVIPSEILDRSIGEYREQFHRFQIDLDLGTDATVPEAGCTCETFHERLRAVRQAHEAGERLRDVDRLVMPPDLESTQNSIRTFRDELATRLLKSPWNEWDLLQEVREGRHPLCRLVTLVKRLDDLTDDEWTAEMAAVQQSFGVPLSTAIARRKVELTQAEHDSAD